MCLFKSIPADKDGAVLCTGSAFPAEVRSLKNLLFCALIDGKETSFTTLKGKRGRTESPLTDFCEVAPLTLCYVSLL